MRWIEKLDFENNFYKTTGRLKRFLQYYWLKFTRHVHLSREKGVLILGLVSFIFFCLTLFLQLTYDNSVYRYVDGNTFQKTFTEKETYAEKTIESIKQTIQSNGISALYEDNHLYDESKEQEVAFHIYKGDQLLFWSSNEIALDGVDGFEFSREFYYEAENANVVVIQSFFREYRCVALIKIKDNVFPKKNSAYNNFAKAFQLPGSVVVSKEIDSKGIAIHSKVGDSLFSLSNSLVKVNNFMLEILAIGCWLVFLIFLVFTLSSVIVYTKRWNLKSYRKVYVGILLFVTLLFFFFAWIEFPSLWFDAPFMSPMSYYSKWIPSMAHLWLWLIYFYAIAFILNKNPIGVKRRMPQNMKTSLWWCFTAVVKLTSFLLMMAFFYFIKGMVFHSQVNLAVPYVQEVSMETLVMLLIALFLVYLYYNYLHKIRILYADKSRIGMIVCIHLILTISVALYYGMMGTKIEMIFSLVFSAVLLFIDLYELYYSISTFLYTSPMAFVFINVIVGLSYSYSTEKNDRLYKQMARDISEKNCVFQDDITETILKEKNRPILMDEHLKSLVKTNDVGTDEIVKTYLQKSFFKVFDDKYDFEVQICTNTDSLFLRKANFENVFFRDFKSISHRFKRLENSIFYANQEEKWAVSYFGCLPIDSVSVYLKFYRKASYDRASLWEQSVKHSRMKSVAISQAKYLKGELSYSDGDFHYPAMMSWLNIQKNTRQYTYDFTSSSNYYTHYVHLFGKGKNATVISVPDKQSYMYIIMVTYLFGAFILIVLLYFAEREFTNYFHKKGKSLLTRMQLMFIAPIMIAFLILAVTTFPFFLDQYEKSQFSEIKQRAISVQQNLQQIIGLSDNFTDERETIFYEMKTLSNLFQLDVLLYDKDGRLVVSSRPLFMSADKRKANLVCPQIKFQTNSNLFREESYGSISCYTYYVEAYNLQNECVGYIQMISHTAYYEVRSEIVNLLAIVVDIYLFISIIAIFIIWLLNKKTTRPLALLSNRFAEIRLTGDNMLIDYQEDDEIGELVTQYNKMVTQLQDSVERLARSEREFAWREMARRIAHEIKNPLTPMKLSVQQCLRRHSMKDDHFDEYFKKTGVILIDQIDNLSNIASEFSSFAKASEARCTKMDMVEKLQAAVALFANNSEDVNFTLSLNGFEHVYVWMDDKQVLQIFNNLFRNAIQSIPSGRRGEVSVSFDVSDGFICIQIKDNGCGIPEENRERMFQPNFTTKTSGMGLGLAIVKNILLSGGGDIRFETEVGKGTVFYVTLPVWKE